MDPELAAAVRRFREAGRDLASDRDLDRLLRPRLLRYFLRGPWPADEAEDLVQRTLTRVYSHVDQLHEVDRFVPWLFAIARNVRRTAAADWSLRRSVEAAQVDDGGVGRKVASCHDAEHAVIDGERRAMVWRAILGLPPRQRDCLLLQIREDLSYDEIAAILGLSPLTVRNHLAQAKASLRRSVAPWKENDE